jgi:hypothetical protein
MREDNNRQQVEILCDDPVPTSIESALRGFLSRRPGNWRVRINLRLTGGWWSITITGDFFHRIFIVSRAERTADQVMAKVRGTMSPEPAPPPRWDGRERRAHPRR